MGLEIRHSKRLVRKINRIKGLTDKEFSYAMVRTVLHVRKEAQAVTPVDTGNLRNSARTKTGKQGKKTKGEVVYLADYAIPVHERTWTVLKNGRHKFLEYAVQKSRGFFKRMISLAFKRSSKGG